MNNLIRFKSASGVDCLVNPRYVMFVAPNGDIIGQTSIAMHNGLSLVVIGTVGEVQDLFDGKSPVAV